jgi:hypothetical protein
LSEIAGDAGLLADLKQQVQTNWQTTATNEPEIRLSSAWQDGETTIFLVAIAGLSATDDRFYCASQTWIFADETIEVVSECIDHEADTPVSQVLFESRHIAGNDERPVQVALNGVLSNEVMLKVAAISEETAVYQTILQSLTYQPLLVRSETAAGLEIPNELLTAVVPGLLQNYLTVNDTPSSLRYLFQNSSHYFVNSSAGIELNYLPAHGGIPDCNQFQNEYPALGGVVSLSRIGLSDDGSQALVYVLLECGSVERQAAFYQLVQGDNGWQIEAESATE